MYWGIAIFAFIFLVIGFLIANHLNKSSDVSLLDLVTRDGELSTTKILQLVGGVVGTWIVVKLTLTTGINWDIFAIYLAYVAGVDGFSKVITAKYSSGEPRNSYTPRYTPPRRESLDDGPVGSAKTPEE